MKMLHCPHGGRAAILSPMVAWMHSCTQSIGVGRAVTL